MTVQNRSLYVSATLENLDDLRDLVSEWDRLAEAVGFTGEPRFEWADKSEIALSAEDVGSGIVSKKKRK